MDLSNPAQRIKISPETYIRIDGSEYVVLRNVHAQDGIHIKYDILLIIFELMTWKSIGELVAPWPPEDQAKILHYLEMFKSRKLIMAEDTTLEELPESGLTAQVTSRTLHFNVENHHVMLRDVIRIATYRRAIERAIRPGTVAMDLGCGSGILTMIAAKAGAGKVYAIERREDILYLAERLAEENRLDQTITFIEGLSSEVQASRIDPKPDVLIAEILGSAILEENILEYTIDARERFLAEGGKLIPYKLDIYLFGFNNGFTQNRWEEIEEYQDLYGFDFSLLGKVLCNKATLRTERYNQHLFKAITASVCVKSLDFYTIQEPIFSEPFELTAQEDGNITSLCGYFKAHLDDENILTNSPWAPATHWMNLIYTLPGSVPVKKGDTLKGRIVYDGGALRVLMNE